MAFMRSLFPKAFSGKEVQQGQTYVVTTKDGVSILALGVYIEGASQPYLADLVVIDGNFAEPEHEPQLPRFNSPYSGAVSEVDIDLYFRPVKGLGAREPVAAKSGDLLVGPEGELAMVMLNMITGTKSVIDLGTGMPTGNQNVVIYPEWEIVAVDGDHERVVATRTRSAA